jgi:uncharacterized protein YukE
MAITYAVDLGQVQQVYDDVNAKYQAVAKRLNDMNTNLQQYLQEWTGKDQQTYQGLWTKWSGEITDMNSIITTRALPALQQMMDNITTNEAKNTASWGG